MAEQRAAPAPQGITITRMSEHDLLEVVQIEEQSGLSRWGWAAYYAELQGANRDLMLVARAAETILELTPITGYIVARETAGELHINNFAVRSDYRRRGIGAIMTQRCVDDGWARGCTVSALQSSSSGYPIYERIGYRHVADIQGWTFA